MAHQPIIENESIDALYAAVLKLGSVEECYNFFEDLCTIHEIQSMAQRFHVALMLDRGETYHKIVEVTGASTATISRVNRCLNYGAGGYQIALDKMKEQEEDQ